MYAPSAYSAGMAGRVALVIGSQCGVRQRLSFLPEVAQELYAQLIDPQRGACEPAIDVAGNGGLLIDPAMEDMSCHIRQAVARARAEEATLVLAFVGHGAYADDDFYLLPFDFNGELHSDTAYHVTHRLAELMRPQAGGGGRLDGLILLVDACHSGVTDPSRWIKAAQELGIRWQILTSTDDQAAFDGCFTRALVGDLRDGVSSLGATLRCEPLRYRVGRACPAQAPQWAASDGVRVFVDRDVDEGLWLARNVARGLPLAGAVVAEIERLTAWLQPTDALTQLVSSAVEHRCVAVIGDAGQGKSTLAAALARPEQSGGQVPGGFVDAIVFVSRSSTSGELAQALADQLSRTVEGFPDAMRRFQAMTSLQEWQGLDALQRLVVGPLKQLGGGRQVRVVIDGLDQLPEVSVAPLMDALGAIAREAALAHVQLVVTSRPDTALPASCERLRLGEVEPATVRAYLVRREISPEYRDQIVERAAGNWLVASLMAGLALDGRVEADDLPASLTELYDQELLAAGAAERAWWEGQLRPVLGPLAAAGAGPVLPLPLACEASRRLGGPSSPVAVRDVLARLRGLAVRSNPGASDEHVGLFHSTFAKDYLLVPGNGQFSIDATNAHRAVAEAIAELAPMERHDWRDPLHRYAMAAEPDHLWAAGYPEKVIASLVARELPILRENLTRWEEWHDRIEGVLGADHPDTLLARNNIASWTGEVGDARQALRLLTELLPDRVRVQGADHPATLATRNNIAYWTGRAGDAREALWLSAALLVDQMRVLGDDDPNTLRTRSNIAYWTGQAGDTREALRLLTELLPDYVWVLGADHPFTLGIHSNVAYWTGEAGDARQALRLFTELLLDQERVLGHDHPDTLTTRNNIAYWTVQAGDPTKALRLFIELLLDCRRVLGPDHPDTLATERWIAALSDPPRSSCPEVES